jgi:hypothetical protein
VSEIDNKINMMAHENLTRKYNELTERAAQWEVYRDAHIKYVEQIKKDYDALLAVANEMVEELRERHSLNCLELQENEQDICICGAREHQGIIQKYKDLVGQK